MRDFARKYFDLLNNDYKGINLTRIDDFEDFYNKQILDSIEPLKQSTVFKDAILQRKLLIDIGFGGGFPILPLAYCLPDIKFLGVETRNKKVKVVREISENLGLKNVKFVHNRIEDILIDSPAVCSLKAVGKVGDFLGKINTVQKIDVFFYKGPNFHALEAESLMTALKFWEIIEEKDISIPGAHKRSLIGFQPKNVPHGTNNSKNLMKVSELF